MKKPICLALLLSALVPCLARTIHVEKLSKPEKPLSELSPEQVVRKLIVNNVDTLNFIEGYSPTVLAQSELPKKLVNTGYKSLFTGMFAAYAQHRPFAISPDMIWLLICQGFSRHVEANSEALRDKFVDFDSQRELVITTDKLPSADDWTQFIGDFKELVSKNTKGNITELLECNFSTTTSAERVASQATILNSMKNYFRYTVIRVVCGIPEIKLHGTLEDWQEIIRRTKELSKYDLQWWTDELIPILEHIASSAAGDVDKTFWRDMFKYHTKEVYGNPKYVDGWIVKFYPYLSNGKRSELKEVSLGSTPDEIVRVPIKFIDEVSKTSYDLELCAGFLGLEQNRRSYMLTPKIGWFLYEVKTTDNIDVPKHYDDLELNLTAQDSLPESLFRVESIDRLTLRRKQILLEQPKKEITTNPKGVVMVNYARFGTLELPLRLANIKIKKLIIRGTVIDNNFKPLPLAAVKAWFAEYMPDCEVEIYSF